MLTLSLLVTALLFGGMALFAFGFAAFLFKALPPELARATIRRAFPPFYLFVIAAGAAAAALTAAHDEMAAVLLALVAATTLPTRQILMPAINRAADAGASGRFKALHGLSVAITLGHLALTAYVLARFAGRMA
jgi:hypothetical protein